MYPNDLETSPAAPLLLRAVWAPPIAAGMARKGPPMIRNDKPQKTAAPFDCFVQPVSSRLLSWFEHNGSVAYFSTTAYTGWAPSKTLGTALIDVNASFIVSKVECSLLVAL